MDKPTTDEVVSWSQLNFARYGYGDADKLQVVIDRATGYVSWVTGQVISLTTDLDASMSPTGNPADLEPLMGQAIQMRVEQVVLQGRTGYLGSAAEIDVISGFTAGSYSETRRQGGFSRAGAAEKSINKWPSLEELLWMLMTPERYSFWLAFVSGQATADFQVEEVDWRGYGSVVSFFQPWDRFVFGPGNGLGM